MKTGRKWKSSSPEPTRAKVAKRDPRAYAESRLTFSPEKRIFTPSKRKVPNASSPRRHSSRFKCHGQETGNSESGLDMVQSSISLESSPLQSEVDTELGLVIRLDEEGTREPEHLRKKSGGKLMKGLQTNDNRALAHNERNAEGSDLFEDSEEEFRKLDRDLAIKSKQHNLTSVHVRSIIHEVITNEHVVAMMKAAIRETQDMPMFEPKMTRSKLKEVVEKGVGMPNWNISPIKQSKEIKPPQFVDIPLEDEEDSSDEEYYPDEDEEDETAEETILESDMDSIASSPRIGRQARSCTPIEISECDEETSNSPRMKQRHLRVEAVPMGPPAPPSQSGIPSRPSRGLDSFMEKLHAVDEELELNPLSMGPYSVLSSGENAEESLVACRTRSKRPLRDVPLDQLEAELKAPDITPDMYDCISSLEDKEWSHWLQGLMTSHLDNEEDGDDDDDDDPEYNFLEDLDEPDLEDYRNDRAVRITKKEVNELMEELFETFQDELRVNEDEEAHEEDEEQEKVPSQSLAKFNVPQAMRFEEPLVQMLTVCRRTVREQLDALQQRREHQSRPHHNAPGPAMLLIPSPCTLMVTPTQKRQLQQQVQQHVQLLTQVNMLCSSVEALQSQATTTKLFLVNIKDYFLSRMELQSFAERAEQMRAVVVPGFKSAFRVCNFQPSLDLLEELEKTQPAPQPKSTKSHAVHRYPFLPPHLAWLFATRSVFLYPELLPHCSLDPALQPPRSKTIYTKGEDGLIVLGLKHFSETEFPYHLMSQYLLQPKRVEQLRVRVKDMCLSRTADNIIKFYCQHNTVPALPVACCPVVAGEERPPVERDKSIMPNWLLVLNYKSRTISQAPPLPSTEMSDGELWKEDMEAGAEVGGEDMASALFASPLLKLSESPCSSHSNLSNISHMESSTETMMESSLNTGEQHSSHFSQKNVDGTTNSPADTNGSEGQVSSTGEVPGLLTFTSGTENQEPPGGGGGLNKNYGGEEGEGHPYEGGEERDANDQGERRGDGDGGRERQGNGGRDKNDDDKDGDVEREEEEEDFDELTQDEDEEEVMSSASEESVLSVPELQETMEKLTWLASERRLCGEGDSEEDNSPNSPTSPTSPISQNSQEENSEDEEDGAIKGEELEPTEGEGGKLPEGDAPQEDDPPQISGKGAGRGRGRARPPPRSLRKSRRQDRGSKDTSKLLLLCDDHILDNDPMRESKDIAYAQAYLNRVREALQDTPGKVEEFLCLLYEFEQGSESRSVVELFCQLKPLLKDWPELLRDFAAFLLPEQALECGLFEEQQAFERSRRFLRQLEISFGENPTHYQKIVKALQAASAPTPAGVEELKTQMATLLKGHTHLQGEFYAFFDELRPPPARPGQFEEAIWPEDGGNLTEGGDGLSLGSGGFEEVTLPDLEEEEETQKIPQITGKSRKRKELGEHRNYKQACNWPEKHCPCHCHFSSHDAKHRRHKRKGCPRCHGIKTTVGSKSLKTSDHSFPTADPLPEKQDEREESEKGVEEKKETETELKDESGSGANSPHPGPEVQPWECTEADPSANPEERDERDADEEEDDEEDEWKEGGQCSSPHKSTREEEVLATEHSDTFVHSGDRELAQQSRQSPLSETPVCAKNISLTPSGEKVVLWTREADRVILTACQQQGASQSTFQSVSAQLGNKTANEVSKRFRDLMRLFHTSACQASSDEEATEQQSATDEEQD
ncbi:hypothetical protein QTP70_013892 [Hemibagrus guttatus]|uniref:GON-4-like protein n=1 Tax=Hemibagrus guttatus TaxID=175788 RepID=A0AAE0RF54_9TELE|nr:hypothetical protein QTP70_013892 [Hemibagrus guttatus]KAK3572291.1 hypothetical protein QTP86_030249 [Hemibagrus guttatus]